MRLALALTAGHDLSLQSGGYFPSSLHITVSCCGAATLLKNVRGNSIHVPSGLALTTNGTDAIHHLCTARSVLSELPDIELI
jgi:hypothetical protein